MQEPASRPNCATPTSDNPRNDYASRYRIRPFVRHRKRPLSFRSAPAWRITSGAAEPAAGPCGSSQRSFKETCSSTSLADGDLGGISLLQEKIVFCAPPKPV